MANAENVYYARISKSKFYRRDPFFLFILFDLFFNVTFPLTFQGGFGFIDTEKFGYFILLK